MNNVAISRITQLQVQSDLSTTKSLRLLFTLTVLKKENRTMKQSRLRRNAMSVIAMMLSLLLVNLTYAGTSPKGSEGKNDPRSEATSVPGAKAQSAQQQYAPEELELLRIKLLEIVDAVQELAILMGNPEYISRLDASRAHFEHLSTKELNSFRSVLDPSRMNLGLAEARATIAKERTESADSSTKSNVRRKGRSNGSVSIQSAINPRPSPGTVCNGLFGAGRPSEDAILAVEAVFNAAELVKAIADRACNTVLVVLGEGGNCSVCCLVVDAILLVAKLANAKAKSCDNEFTKRTVDGSFDRLENIHSDLESSVANDNSNKTMIVNNDNSNKTAIITEVDAKAVALSSQISAGTTEILNKVESKGDQIINNDNVNRTQIINNDNTNTANIITNDNANKTMIINNDNANFAATINELRALGCDVIRLLTTPDGQRSSSIASCSGKPGWPYSWNKPNGATVSTTSLRAPALGDAFSNERAQDGVPILPIMGTVTMESHLLAGKLVPTYYLPASKGGLIEQVKLMVWNTIESQTELKIAKDETSRARIFAQEADRFLSARDYVEAYRQYCLAYQTLVPAN